MTAKPPPSHHHHCCCCCCLSHLPLAVGPAGQPLKVALNWICTNCNCIRFLSRACDFYRVTRFLTEIFYELLLLVGWMDGWLCSPLPSCAELRFRAAQLMSARFGGEMQKQVVFNWFCLPSLVWMIQFIRRFVLMRISEKITAFKWKRLLIRHVVR